MSAGEWAWHRLLWLMAGLALGLGLFWRDCVLLGGSALLVAAAFRAGMDAGAPWDGWRAGLRCGAGGLLLLACGLLLLCWVVYAQLGAWPVAPNRTQAVFWLALAAGTTEVVRSRGRAVDWRSLWGVAVVGATAVVAAGLADDGLAAAACLFAALAALFVIAHGWRLIQDVMPALSRSAQR